MASTSTVETQPAPDGIDDEMARPEQFINGCGQDTVPPGYPKLMSAMSPSLQTQRPDWFKLACPGQGRDIW